MDFAWGAVAFLTTTVLALTLRDALRVPALLKRNYADREVITGAGVIAIFGCLLAAALVTVLNRNRAGWLYDTVLVIVGFGLVGLLDDVVGNHGARGFRGHLRALQNRRLTSGMLKLIIGVAVAVVATQTTEGVVVQLLRVVVIAGCANVVNLLDLAPGRATKTAVIAMTPVVVLEWSQPYFVLGPIMFVSAVLALLLFEIREEVMLGDAGANALGATIGLAWVIALSGNDSGLWVAAGLVVAINVAGELTSFSQVIERVAPLRALDRLGRRK